MPIHPNSDRHRGTTSGQLNLVGDHSWTRAARVLYKTVRIFRAKWPIPGNLAALKKIIC